MTDTMTTLDASAARFANLDLDDRHVDGVTAPPVVVAPVAPPPVVVDPLVSAEGAARASADEALARSMGFSPKPPVYTIGTVVNEIGVDNARQSRKDFEALPFTDTACKDLADRVKSEKREDHLIDVDSLKMLSNGALVVPWNGALPMTERGFEGLCTFTTPGGGGYLRECETDLRATNMNRWFPKARKLDKRAWNRAVKEAQQLGHDAPPQSDFEVPRKVTLREREMNGKREIFATTGPRYGKFDVDQIAQQIAAGVAEYHDSRCEITYDGYRARIVILAHSDVQPEKYVAGEIFKAGIEVSTADDGSGAIHVSATLLRNLCRNLLTLDLSKLKAGSRRHVGSTESISESVKSHMDLALSKVAVFMQKWSEGAVEDILSRYSLNDPEEVFQGLVLNRVVYVPGVKPEEMVQRLQKAWDKEPGRFKTAYINAVSRMAHEESWDSPWVTSDLEAVAGDLMMQKVWNCVPPVEDNPFLDA